jgi:MFS family permease
MIMTCYGGGFSSIPSYIGDLFGTKQLGAIHGYILTAWAVAGLVGSIFVSWIRESTGSYQGTLIVFSGMFIVSLAISLLIRVDIQKLRDLNENRLLHKMDNMKSSYSDDETMENWVYKSCTIIFFKESQKQKRSPDRELQFANFQGEPSSEEIPFIFK